MNAGPAVSDPRLTRLQRVKPPPSPTNPGDLVRLPLARQAWVYQRLSSHEQKKKSIWSIEMQEALADQARSDGYQDEQILVERRDLGISGTKGREDRPGLAALVAAVEAGQVEAVYVVHISRLSRDQTLIDGLELGELFKKHNVVLCLPVMRLNLRDSMHMRLYRQEIERAADEIELLKMRLGGPRHRKALSGRYDGRAIPPGYLVERDPTSPTFDRFVAYEPHAVVVRQVFQALIQTGTPTRAARWLRDRSIVFPAFSLEIPETDTSRSSLARKSTAVCTESGIAITAKAVRSIVTNPAYLGWWLVDGQPVRSDNHAALVDRDTFLMAQDVLAAHGRGPNSQRGRRSVTPQILSGLVVCSRHDVPAHVQGTHSKYGRYICDAGYRHGGVDGHCTVLDARILDEPVADVVLNQCRFPEYANAVLSHLEAERVQEHDDTRQRNRELARLRQEVETLKENLAVTRSAEQTAMVFDLIDRRTARIQELYAAKTVPHGQRLTAAQVGLVRTFLTDLRCGWSVQPTSLKNDLLRLILDTVEVHVRRDRLVATIVWRSGQRLSIRIERSRRALAGKVLWTDVDEAWLSARYATATHDEISARFPNRSMHAIKMRANHLGLRRARPTATEKRPWTEPEVQAIRAYAEGAIDYDHLSEALPGRTANAIRYKREELGLRIAERSIYYRVEDGSGLVVSSGSSFRPVTRPPARTTLR